jgi:hypothetical protein
MALLHRVGWDARFCRRSPWFWPLMAAARSFEDSLDWPTLAELDAAYLQLTAADSMIAPLRFAANVRKQDKHNGGRVVLHALYDARITLAGEVPTRERDWHDLLNMLCFATYPRSKRALHARQYACLAARVDGSAKRLPNARTPEQDALTLFDEGGVVLAATPAAAAQLSAAARDEREGVCQELVAAHALRVVPFGHALFEHLVEGLRVPGGCTQTVIVSEPLHDDTRFMPALDRALCACIGDAGRFQSPRDCAQIRLATALSGA